MYMEYSEVDCYRKVKKIENTGTEGTTEDLKYSDVDC